MLPLALQEFHQDGNGPENVGIYNLSRGVNRFCLSKPGEPGRWECGAGLGLKVGDPGSKTLRDVSDIAASSLSLQ
jgi:hypothetical protein